MGVSGSGSGTPSLLHPQFCPSRALALSVGSCTRLAAALSSSLLACQGKSHPEYRSCRGCACLLSHAPAPRRSAGDCAGCGEHPWDRLHGCALGAKAWAGEVGMSGEMPASRRDGKLS